MIEDPCYGGDIAGFINNVSTLQTRVFARPAFPLGKICGRLERVPARTDTRDGGLRTKGIYKEDTDAFPLITYITVVRDRAGVIGRCMDSVFEQSYPNVEYIVIDGASTDGTLDIIEANADKIDYYVSQPDSGIYGAMNKGVSLASGRLICMMNSDDICAPGAAQIVADCYRETGAELICGRVDTFSGDKIEISPLSPRALIPLCAARYLDLNHQALYASRTAFEMAGMFDEGYLIVSDYKWELECIKYKLKFELIDDKLALFNTGGVSSTAVKRVNGEFCALVREQFPFLSARQAETYFWGLTYGFAFRAFAPLFHKFALYLEKEEAFRMATYRTALHVCICDCWAIEILTGSYGDLKRTRENLEVLLSQSLAGDYGVGKRDFEDLSATKDIVNAYYDKYRLAVVRGFVAKAREISRICLKAVITRSVMLTAIFMKWLKRKNMKNILINNR